METIDLKLDEANDLTFNVMIEGTTTGPVTIRLMCEADDMSYIFNGSYTENNEVKVNIPAMKKNGSIQENKPYSAKLEVMVENRIFVPLEFGLKFKETIKVFAEVASKPVVQESAPTKQAEQNKTLITKPAPVPLAVSATITAKSALQAPAAVVETKVDSAKKVDQIKERQNKAFKTLAEKLKK